MNDTALNKHKPTQKKLPQVKRPKSANIGESLAALVTSNQIKCSSVQKFCFRLGVNVEHKCRNLTVYCF